MAPVRLNAPYTAAFSAQVLAPDSLSLASSRSIVSFPKREWRNAVSQRLNELCALAKGWDGYQAGPVNFETAYFAVRMMEAACVSRAPIPSIVPGTRGDLQVEWHLPGVDLELHVLAPSRVIAWRRTDSTGEDGEEISLTNDFTVVAAWLREIQEPAIAPVPAAA